MDAKTWKADGRAALTCAGAGLQAQQCPTASISPSLAARQRECAPKRSRDGAHTEALCGQRAQALLLAEPQCRCSERRCPQPLAGLGTAHCPPTNSTWVRTLWLKSAARASARTGTSASVTPAAASATLALVPVAALTRAALQPHGAHPGAVCKRAVSCAKSCKWLRAHSRSPLQLSGLGGAVMQRWLSRASPCASSTPVRTPQPLSPRCFASTGFLLTGCSRGCKSPRMQTQLLRGEKEQRVIVSQQLSSALPSRLGCATEQAGRAGAHRIVRPMRGPRPGPNLSTCTRPAPVPGSSTPCLQAAAPARPTLSTLRSPWSPCCSAARHAKAPGQHTLEVMQTGCLFAFCSFRASLEGAKSGMQQHALLLRQSTQLTRLASPF